MSDRDEKSKTDGSDEDRSHKSRKRLARLAYGALFAGLVVVFLLTEPDVSYEPNVTFQVCVATVVVGFLLRAVLALRHEMDLGQILKVVFWIGLEVYILEDMVPLFGSFNKAFPHFPEFLVLTYVIAVILKERGPAPEDHRKANP